MTQSESYPSSFGCLLDRAYKSNGRKWVLLLSTYRCLLDRAYKSNSRKRILPFNYLDAYLIGLTNSMPESRSYSFLHIGAYLIGLTNPMVENESYPLSPGLMLDCHFFKFYFFIWAYPQLPFFSNFIFSAGLVLGC